MDKQVLETSNEPQPNQIENAEMLTIRRNTKEEESCFSVDCLYIPENIKSILDNDENSLWTVIQYLLMCGYNFNQCRLVNDDSFSLPIPQDAISDLLLFILGNPTDIDTMNYYGHTALISAVKRNFVQVVKVLVEGGANVNILMRNGNSALHVAAKNANVEIGKLLIKFGANVNLKGKKHTSVVETAINSIVDVTNEYHVNRVCSFLTLLFSAKASVNVECYKGRTPLRLAVAKCCLPLIQTILRFNPCKDNFCNTLAYIESISIPKNIGSEIFQALHSYGFNIVTSNLCDLHENDLFHSALRNNYVEILFTLITFNPDGLMRQVHVCQNIYNLILGPEANDDQSDCCLYTLECKAMAIDSVLKRGLNVTTEYIEGQNINDSKDKLDFLFKILVQNKGCDILSSYIVYDMVKTKDYGGVVKDYIRKTFVDVNARNNQGRTILHIAAITAQDVLIEALIHCGADINVVDNFGYTALDYIIRKLPKDYLKTGTEMYMSGVENSNYECYFADCDYITCMEMYVKYITVIRVRGMPVVDKILKVIRKNYIIRTFYSKCVQEICDMCFYKLRNFFVYDIITGSIGRLSAISRINKRERDKLQRHYPIFSGVLMKLLKKGEERKLILEDLNDVFKHVFPSVVIEIICDKMDVDEWRDANFSKGMDTSYSVQQFVANYKKG